MPPPLPQKPGGARSSQLGWERGREQEERRREGEEEDPEREVVVRREEGRSR